MNAMNKGSSEVALWVTGQAHESLNSQVLSKQVWIQRPNQPCYKTNTMFFLLPRSKYEIVLIS